MVFVCVCVDMCWFVMFCLFVCLNCFDLNWCVLCCVVLLVLSFLLFDQFVLVCVGLCCFVLLCYVL